MFELKKAVGYLVLFAVIGVFAAPAFAGLINDGVAYGTPFFDGEKTWAGTTYFPDPYPADPENTTIAGYVEWVVYGPNAFPFTGSGYTPTSGQFTYVYQIYNTGIASFANYSVGIDNPANNISSFSDTSNGFTVSGDHPTNGPNGHGAFETGAGSWNFISGLLSGGNSEALVYNSQNSPLDYLGIVIDHGMYEFTEPVPSPSENAIPEPNALILLMAGSVAAMAMKKFRG